MERSALSRRQLLQGFGVSVPLALSGCSTSGDETDAKTEKLRLNELIIENLEEGTPHTIEVVVSINGGIRYWDTHQLAGRPAGEDVSQEDAGENYTTLDVALPDEPITFTVSARVDSERTGRTSSANGIEWNKLDHPDENMPCVNVRVRITPSGELVVRSYETDCGTEDGQSTQGAS
ncbi:hypothetical protein [Halorhabdus sp. BNX81]|uniref:hypothetical protein n=1 Tax=Halorhabdus sp. BNX81 TaxID=2980181 RepID=UPI0023DD0255|nr:hypothetical protein [Halorhabdus sp. BNX81]WEL22733.1 Uncharacterized protein HBNXHr_2697 [Halorhabdus sp. BNX81]